MNTVPSQKVSVLRAIDTHWRERGYAPSVRELAALMGFSTISAVSYWLRRLEGEGMVTENAGRARTLRLTEAGRALLAAEEVPRAL